MTLCIFLVLIWTQVQAYETSKFETIELTYEDLAHELSLKKRPAPTRTDSTFPSLGSREWSIGFAFSNPQYQLTQTSKSFSQSGLDFRWNQSFQQSSWTLEGQLKSFGSTASGPNSAESKVLGAMAKIENSLPDKMSYILGAGTSLNFINTRDAIKSQQSTDLAFIGSAGIRGPINSRFSWRLEVQGSSPMSSRILKGGIETSLLISSSL